MYEIVGKITIYLFLLIFIYVLTYKLYGWCISVFTLLYVVIKDDFVTEEAKAKLFWRTRLFWLFLRKARDSWETNTEYSFTNVHSNKPIKNTATINFNNWFLPDIRRSHY